MLQGARHTRMSLVFDLIGTGNDLLGMRDHDALLVELLRCSKIAADIKSVLRSTSAIRVEKNTYFFCAFVKKPVSMFWTAIVAVKALFAGTVEKFFGKVNFDEGILLCGMISPIGTGLHEPVLICCPFVMVCPAQKLMLVNERKSGTQWTKYFPIETAKGH